MPHWINQPWQRNLSKTASGKTGAVHFLPQHAILDAAEMFGLRLLDLREDTWVIGGSAELLSNNFVFLKTRETDLDHRLG